MTSLAAPDDGGIEKLLSNEVMETIDEQVDDLNQMIIEIEGSESISSVQSPDQGKIFVSCC